MVRGWSWTAMAGLLWLSGLGREAAVVDGVAQRAEVALVAVGVDLGEGDERAVERVGRAEVGGDRDAVAGARVGARERPCAQRAVLAQLPGRHRADVDRALAVPELADVEVA